MTGCNYFVASSPRHLLLFAGLALEHAARDDNRLFFIEHVPQSAVAAYLSMLGQWRASPFAGAEALEADYRPLLGSAKKGALKRAFRSRNRARIDAALAERAPDAVYVACDDFFESQYLLHRSKLIKPDRRGIYVEDGVSVYEHSYQNQHVRNRPKEWARTLRYFPWWRRSLVPGTSGWLDEGFVAFPDLVLEPFKQMRLDALPRARYTSPELGQLGRLWAEAFGVDAAALNRCDVLIAVTHTKWSGLLPGYRDRMRAICRRLLDGGKRVAIKPHPRDPTPDPLGLEDHPNLYRVPSQVMFEVLAVCIENPALLVVGDASTSVAATRWLRPEWRVVALRHDPGGVDSHYLARLFAASGVEIEADPEALLARCLETPGRDRRGAAAPR